LPIFFSILFIIPIVVAHLAGWRYVPAFWAVLFVGSGVFKMMGLGF
jgi:hypothetical protein